MMIDRVSRLDRFTSLGAQGGLGGVTLADSPPYWAAFRDDLVANRELLEAHKVQMSEDDDETVRLMAGLTCVRLQDIIAWMIAAQGALT